jgi:hypothetical protein
MPLIEFERKNSRLDVSVLSDLCIFAIAGIRPPAHYGTNLAVIQLLPNYGTEKELFNVIPYGD